MRTHVVSTNLIGTSAGRHPLYYYGFLEEILLAPIVVALGMIPNSMDRFEELAQANHVAIYRLAYMPRHVINIHCLKR